MKPDQIEKAVGHMRAAPALLKELRKHDDFLSSITSSIDNPDDYDRLKKHQKALAKKCKRFDAMLAGILK